MSAFETLQARGFVQQSTEGVRAILDGPPTPFYVGFDPTGDSLHAGHLLPVMVMAHLQRAGHQPIAVVGGGTGMVGDPSGKEESRQLLTVEGIAHNKGCLKSQLARFIDFGPGKGQLVDNADWLLGLNYIDFLRDIGKHFSVNTMLSKASVKLRLEKGLSFLEFNYQLLQAFDYLELNRRFGCKLQVGGDDQWGNIVAGIDLIRRVEGGESHGLTIPLLTTATGAKMGKTVAGAVWLDSEKMSAFDYYQYWINVDDRDVGRFLKLYTFLSLDEIGRLEALQGADIRAAKAVLAFEATAIAHGKETTELAQAGAVAAFGGGKDVQLMPTFNAKLPVSVVQLLVESGLCDSNSDARRQIKGGAIKIAGEKVVDARAELTPDHLDTEGAVVLSRGKKKKLRVLGS